LVCGFRDLWLDSRAFLAFVLGAKNLGGLSLSGLAVIFLTKLTDNIGPRKFEAAFERFEMSFRKFQKQEQSGKEWHAARGW
jgi:hypothetical protein